MFEFNELKFVKFEASDLFEVPEYLFEQVPGKSWTVKRLYKFAPTFLINSSHRFWTLVDDKGLVKGVLWVVIDLLSQKLNVIVFSVDKEYQGRSALKGARDFLRQFIKDFNETKTDTKLKAKINWVTAEPWDLHQIGARRPRTVLMEV